MKTKFSHVPYDPATTHIEKFSGWEIHTFQTMNDKEEGNVTTKFSGFIIHEKTGRYLDTPHRKNTRKEIQDGFKAGIENGVIKSTDDAQVKADKKPLYFGARPQPGGRIVIG